MEKEKKNQLKNNEIYILYNSNVLLQITYENIFTKVLYYNACVLINFFKLLWYITDK